jgi:uncharacterized membrane protein YeiB
LIPYILLTNKFNNLPPFEGFVVFLAVFSIQLVFSSLWMSKYTLGPFEWLLRSFTYWQWQPLRKHVQNEFDHEKQMITVTSPHSYKNYYRKIINH